MFIFGFQGLNMGQLQTIGNIASEGKNATIEYMCRQHSNEISLPLVDNLCSLHVLLRPLVEYILCSFLLHYIESILHIPVINIYIYILAISFSSSPIYTPNLAIPHKINVLDPFDIQST